jgi:hypothetical protein
MANQALRIASLSRLAKHADKVRRQAEALVAAVDKVEKTIKKRHARSRPTR